MPKNNLNKNGFTLIELLVVCSIIAILVAISLFGLKGARAAARDARRQGDLEQIRGALEIYRADCNKYPTTISGGATLTGDGSSSSCLAANTYITVPKDPNGSNYYYSGTSSTYQICAYLEQGSGSASCGGSCGGNTCNYKVLNP